jgi:hypothetical protein
MFTWCLQASQQQVRAAVEAALGAVIANAIEVEMVQVGSSTLTNYYQAQGCSPVAMQLDTDSSDVQPSGISSSVSLVPTPPLALYRWDTRCLCPFYEQQQPSKTSCLTTGACC